MDHRRFFLKKDPYDIAGTQAAFMGAVRADLEHHASACPEYGRILERRGFRPDMLRSEADLARIPPLTTLYLKRRRLLSVPEERLIVRAESSGTGGLQSRVGFDRRSMFYGLSMAARSFARHGIITPVPARYIVLGYEPGENARMGAAKTAYGVTKFAPALGRVYALRDRGGAYEPDVEGVADALARWGQGRVPVRFVGFPSYMYFLLMEMERRGLRLSLPRRSMVILGGGWKRFAGAEIGRDRLLAMVRDRLGIGPERVLEFFSAVEHPVPYVKCSCGLFHVPIYSRVIVRDPLTLEPLPFGEPGLLNFVTPLVGSMPLTSVMTDDVAVLKEHCSCGIATPGFRLLGRAGARGIHTCSVSAAELMGVSR